MIISPLPHTLRRKSVRRAVCTFATANITSLLPPLPIRQARWTTLSSCAGPVATPPWERWLPLVLAVPPYCWCLDRRIDSYGSTDRRMDRRIQFCTDQSLQVKSGDQILYRRVYGSFMSSDEGDAQRDVVDLEVALSVAKTAARGAGEIIKQSFRRCLS